jgi:hypothetical protein
MKKPILLSVLALTALAACGGAIPPPNENLGGAEAAARSAQEIGADRDPQAALYLKMANDQIAQAKDSMRNGDDAEASRSLYRAKADAELSLQLAKEVSARKAADEAKAKTRAAVSK